jgi:hypothetical protein
MQKAKGLTKDPESGWRDESYGFQFFMEKSSGGAPSKQ